MAEKNVYVMHVPGAEKNVLNYAESRAVIYTFGLCPAPRGVHGSEPCVVHWLPGRDSNPRPGG